MFQAEHNSNMTASPTQSDNTKMRETPKLDRQWMMSANNSMAQLDKVTTNVYNLCLQDAKTISATATRSNKQNVLQRNVWGSSSSIPDLLRQHSERQNEKSARGSRPSSGKTTRPQSGNTKVRRKAASNVPAVFGEKCDFLERPPDGSMHAVTHGWVPPCGGVTSPSCWQESDKSDSAEVYDRCHLPFDDSSNVPELEPTTQTAESDENYELEDLAERNKPPERICFSLPNVSYDLDDSIDTPRLFSPSSQKTVDRDGISEVIDDSCDHLQQQSTAITSYTRQEPDLNRNYPVTHIIGRDDTSHSAKSDKQQNTAAVSSKVGHCAGQRKSWIDARPPSGRTQQLRNVKSRISSGVVPIQRGHSAGKRGVGVRDAGTPVPIVCLMYDDDEREEEEEEGWVGRKGRRRSRERNVPTMMSQIDFSNEETNEAFAQGNVEGTNEEDSELTAGSVSHLKTKCVSRGVANYYDVAMRNRAKASTDKQSGSSVKTTTTMELAEDGLKETKSRSTIEGFVQQHGSCKLNGAQAQKHRSPTPDRPRPRPQQHTNLHQLTTVTREKSEPSKATTSQSRVARSDAKTMKVKAIKATLTTTPDNYSPSDKQLELAMDTGPVAEEIVKKSCESDLDRAEITSKDQHLYDTWARGHVSFRSSTSDLNDHQPKSACHHCDSGLCSHQSILKTERKMHLENRKRIKSPTAVQAMCSTNYVPETESAGQAACRQLHERLLHNNVPISLHTLQRALLPPTEYQPRTTVYASRRTSAMPDYTAGLLSKPSVWLAKEAKNVRIAKKNVRRANACILAQQKKERKKQKKMAQATLSESNQQVL